jgi:hypothetical protein
MDDTFVVWRHGKIILGEFLDYLYAEHPPISLTMVLEVEKNGSREVSRTT